MPPEECFGEQHRRSFQVRLTTLFVWTAHFPLVEGRGCSCWSSAWSVNAVVSLHTDVRSVDSSVEPLSQLSRQPAHTKHRSCVGGMLIVRFACKGCTSLSSTKLRPYSTAPLFTRIPPFRLYTFSPILSRLYSYYYSKLVLACSCLHSYCFPLLRLIRAIYW